MPKQQQPEVLTQVFDEAFALIMERLNVVSIAGLAEKIGTTAIAISQWKTRRSWTRLILTLVEARRIDLLIEVLSIASQQQIRNDFYAGIAIDPAVAVAVRFMIAEQTPVIIKATKKIAKRKKPNDRTHLEKQIADEKVTDEEIGAQIMCLCSNLK